MTIIASIDFPSCYGKIKNDIKYRIEMEFNNKDKNSLSRAKERIVRKYPKSF
jgi:hypothetical protein